MTDVDWRALLVDAEGKPQALVESVSRRDAPVEVLATIASDEALLKRVPQLAATVFFHPAAPRSVANRALLTCDRIGVVPAEFSEWGDFKALVADVAADGDATNPALDAEFAEALSASAGEGESESEIDAAGDSSLDTHEPGAEVALTAAEVAPKAKGKGRRAARIDFTKLKLFEKVRLATLGNAHCRQTLLRDGNRMVALAAIRSPQITDGEIVKAAANRALSEEVIRYIANRKEMMKVYAVKLALVGNPKCPLAITLRLLNTLHAEDVKQLARSKNIPGALAVAAKKLAAARGPQ